jgi:hypothetical protein
MLSVQIAFGIAIFAAVVHCVAALQDHAEMKRKWARASAEASRPIYVAPAEVIDPEAEAARVAYQKTDKGQIFLQINKAFPGYSEFS